MVERGDGVARGGRAEGGCTVQRGGVRSGRGIREGVVEEVIATGDEIRGWVSGVRACGGAIHSWLGHAALIQKGVVRMGVFIASPYIVVHHHNVHGSGSVQKRRNSMGICRTGQVMVLTEWQ